MPIGKNKKSVQAYVRLETKNKITKAALDRNVSESKIAGEVLDSAFQPQIIRGQFHKFEDETFEEALQRFKNSKPNNQ